MRETVAQLVESETIKVPKSMVRVHPVSLLFLQKGADGCLQLDLLLCDTYQMDAWFPFGWKWKKELEKSSYSVWAIDELERYIVGRLYPKKSGTVEDFIIFVGDFRRMMDRFSKINPDNNFMFSVAVDISTDVLDLLHAMK